MEINKKEIPLEGKKGNKRGKNFYSVVENVLLLFFSVVIIAYLFFFQNAIVSGPSMNPTLNDRDFILASKGMKKIDYGDIVIVDGEQLEKALIKRVIGMPGDKIEIKKTGEVYLNDERLDESYTLENSNPWEFDEIITLSDSEVWVMGDNRNDSLDSRILGPIPISYLKGKALIGLYPFKTYE